MADTRTHSQGSLRLHQVMQLSLARPLSSSKCGIIGVYMRHTITDMHVFCFAKYLSQQPRQLATCLMEFLR